MKCYCDECFAKRAAKYDRMEHALYILGAIVVVFWTAVVAVVVACQ